MKSPFKKFRDFALSKHGSKEKAPESPWALADESQDVTIGMEDVENMRAQYEGLLTNAQIISGATYDYSRSLQDMAWYMVDTFGQINDGEIGNIFSMLGKVQFEISKLLDQFAAHVSQTIMTPTEMIISELQQVEVMKEQYDEKRQVFNIIQKEKPKGKPKKGDRLEHDFELAEKEFKEQANFLSFRLESLKQGRSRSLVTQAARYHSAQMQLFRKCLASINAVEPVMKQLALEKNIDRTLAEEDLGIHGNMFEMKMDGDVLENEEESESVASSPNFPQEIQMDSLEVSEGAKNLVKRHEGSSKSAPMSPLQYFQHAGFQNKQEGSFEQLTHKEVSKYALPSPSGTNGKWTAEAHTTTQGFSPHLLPVKNDFHQGEDGDGHKLDLGGHHGSNNTRRPLFLGDNRAGFFNAQLPLTSVEPKMSMKWNTSHQRMASVDGRVAMFPDLANNGDLAKDGKRYSQSGPLTAKPFPCSKRAPVINDNFVPVYAHQSPPLFKSGPMSRSPIAANACPIIPCSVSPPLMSPPRISELHKLPTPPAGSSTPPKSANLIAHSAPLGRKVQEVPATSSGLMSPLPRPPPGSVTRSFSIPSSANHAQTLKQGKSIHSQTLEGDFSFSPPKPIALQGTTSILHARANGKSPYVSE